MIRTVTPITFAHRGARLEEPENTLAAFGRALEQGATGIETDAWLSRDGEVVLAHDPVVGPWLRRRRISSSTADDLARLGVPRLADVYRELGSEFELSVDVKDPAAGEPMIAVARSAGSGALGRLWMCSPDVDALTAWRGAAEVRLVHSRRSRSIAVPLERHAADLAAARIDAMNLHHTEWTAGLVSLFHRFGLRAFAWDAQEVRHLRAVLGYGVDAVYCDRPDRMVATVGEWVTEQGS